MWSEESLGKRSENSAAVWEGREHPFYALYKDNFLLYFGTISKMELLLLWMVYSMFDRQCSLCNKVLGKQCRNFELQVNWLSEKSEGTCQRGQFQMLELG